MRKALDRPHVLAFLRAQKQVFREAASTANIKRLCEIRDAADNMPAVNAIKALEQLGGDESGHSAGHTRASPGLTIIVQAFGQPPRDPQSRGNDAQVIDATEVDVK